MAFLDMTGLERLWQHILLKLENKVDKDAGKGLSTNDFTDKDKDQLEAIARDYLTQVDKNELNDSITNVLNSFVQPDWFENNPESKAYIKNRTHYDLVETSILFNTTLSLTPSTFVLSAESGMPENLVSTYKDSAFLKVQINGENCRIDYISDPERWDFYNQNSEKILSIQVNGTLVLDASQPSGDYHIYITHDDQLVYQLDEKYIPETLARTEQVPVVDAISENRINEIVGTTVENSTVAFAEQTGIPVIYLSGNTTGMNKDVSVNLNCKYGELVETCSCKWQGSSSLYYPKKNYTIKFNNNVIIKDTWGAHKKYVLKANWVDSSGLRNLLGAIFWGKIVKNRPSAPDRLKELPNGGAIDGFPVWVVLNDQNMGLYTLTIPKDDWLFGMTEEDTQAGFICFEDYRFDVPALGDETDIEIEYAGGDEQALLNSFNNVQSALNSVQSEEDLPALEAVLDVDSVIDYVLFSSMVCHHDGVVKNAIMATYDGVKWFMSAYDMDSIFGNMWDGKSYIYPVADPNINTMHTCRGGNPHKLFEVVFTYYKDKYNDRVWEIISGNTNFSFIPSRVYDVVYNTAVNIPKTLLDEDNRLWPDRPGTNTNNIEQIFNFHRIRFNEYNDSESSFNIYKQIWGDNS